MRSGADELFEFAGGVFEIFLTSGRAARKPCRVDVGRTFFKADRFLERFIDAGVGVDAIQISDRGIEVTGRAEPRQKVFRRLGGTNRRRPERRDKDPERREKDTDQKQERKAADGHGW